MGIIDDRTKEIEEGKIGRRKVSWLKEDNKESIESNNLKIIEGDKKDESQTASPEEIKYWCDKRTLERLGGTNKVNKATAMAAGISEENYIRLALEERKLDYFKELVADCETWAEAKLKINLKEIEKILSLKEVDLKEVFRQEIREVNKEQNEIKKEQSKQIVLITKFSPIPYSQTLMQEYKFLQDKYRRFWRYVPEQGLWKEDAREFICQKLRQNLLGEEQQKITYTKEVVEYIRDLTYDCDFSGELPLNIIPFQNCLFDLNTNKILNYCPEYFVTNKIPVALNPNKTSCPSIHKFFIDVIGEEWIEILYELCAYCMYREQPYQKLFFLIGGGQNGKSTFLELLRCLLGTDNVSSVSPHDMCNSQNKFFMGLMWNKYINISSDISYQVLEDVNKIKEITGGDTITIERKYKEGFPARIYAKQIFSTNQLPIVNDKTEAWYRRPYIIDFPNKISKDKRDTCILQKLTAPDELSGLAWQCIERLKKLKQQKFIFSFDPEVEKVAELYESLSNPLHMFLKSFTDEDGEGYVWKYDLKDKFWAWLAEKKFRIWSEQEINKHMKENGYSESKKTFSRFGETDKRWWAFTGLSWKKKAVQESPMSTGLQTFSYIYNILFKPKDIGDSEDTKTSKVRIIDENCQICGEKGELTDGERWYCLRHAHQINIKKEPIIYIKELILKLEERNGLMILIQDLVKGCKEFNETEINDALRKLMEQGVIFSPKKGYIQRIDIT